MKLQKVTTCDNPEVLLFIYNPDGIFTTIIVSLKVLLCLCIAVLNDVLKCLPMAQT